MNGSPIVESPPGMSLRLRLLLAMVLWVSVGIAAIWLSATRVFASHVERSYHEELEVHVRELARLTRVGPDGQPVLTRPLSDPRYEVPLSGFYWQVTADGKLPLRSASMTRGELDEQVAHSPVISHRLDHGPSGPAITYGFARPVSPTGMVHFVIATDQSELDRLVSGFTRELTAWLLVLALLLLATGLAVIGFGFRPLDRLGRDIAKLRAGKAQRLSGQYPSEIAPLVADLNDYISHNAQMVSRARVQAGNLAHSLRTPLAVVVDEAERLAAGEAAPDSGRALLEQAQMMERHVEYELARVRFTSGARVPGTSTALPQALVPVITAMRRIHPDKSFSVTGPQNGKIDVPADPVDLQELLSILLDNAGKWASAAVAVSIAPVGEGARIVIADDGPGMTPDQIATAFEVGTRFDAGVPGSGLGLAIAKEICDALGATLELRAAPHGLSAIVEIGA